MTDDEYPLRHASEIPEWEIEEMVRDVIEQTMRRDIADRALLWLDLRVDAYKRLNGTLQ
jgi:hypothetical protein